MRPSPAATKLDIRAPVPDAAVKPRPPADLAPIVIAPASIAFAIVAEGSLSDGEPGGGEGGPDGPGAAAADAGPDADPCGTTRVRMQERCSVASTAADQAGQAAEALREAQRAYDTLRERVERAQADADPRGLAAAKDALHKEFRAATRRARGAEDTEAAAREWLTQINELNMRVRDAQRLAEAGAAELRGALPRLERMGVEADAARISAESAEAACREAREQLAACEEDQVKVRLAAATGAAYTPESEALDDAPLAADTGTLADDSFDRQVPSTQAAIAGMSVIVKVLRGDRAARDRLVASIAAGEPDGERLWQSRIAQLVERHHGPGDRGRLPRHARPRHLLVAVHAQRVPRDRRRPVGPRLSLRRRRRVRRRAGPRPARPVARGGLRGPRPDADPQLAARAGARRAVRAGHAWRPTSGWSSTPAT